MDSLTNHQCSVFSLDFSGIPGVWSVSKVRFKSDVSSDWEPKSNSSLRGHKNLMPCFFLPWVYDFPLYFFVFVTLGLLQPTTAPRFIFGFFPQASTANIGLSELTSVSTLNGLFPPY
jgi:hypothetical protein